MLKDGNARFVTDTSILRNVNQERRDYLKSGQNPYAVIVSCSDSRVTPTTVFNAGLGEIFDVRLAGNVVDDDALGSIEYAVEHLNTPLVVVMGHQSCGAVTATYNEVVKGEKVLIPCSSSSRSYLVDEISKLGLSVDRVHTYDTICGTLKNKRVFDEVDYVLFTSPSTVTNMIDMLGVEAIREKKLIAIGPQTAKAIREKEMECFMCKKHSEEGFLKEIIEFKEAENV